MCVVAQILRLLEYREKLRRNSIRNRVTSVFSGQKPGTRIILGILQSFLHFLKAKDKNICLK